MECGNDTLNLEALTLKINSSQSEEEESTHPSPKTRLSPFPKRKLLILTLNGVLADIIPFRPYNRIPDIKFSSKYVFKRPYCAEFLHFCFQNFDLAVWSSRLSRNTDLLLSLLFGSSKHQLIFSWDQSQCTDIGILPHYNHKPLFLKELRKVWDKDGPNLTFESGYYNKTNTILLDDSPIKALFNPSHTSIFPTPYKHDDENDNALGDGGSLRTYLEGLASADDACEYIKKNPFGQPDVPVSRKESILNLVALNVKIKSLHFDNEESTHPLSEKSPSNVPKRKLLILTLDGILADILPFRPPNRPRNHELDRTFAAKHVFERPFYGEFLHFCFQNFDLAVWSATLPRNNDLLLSSLFGRSKHQLVFSWDQSQCTDTGINIRGQCNRNKPLFLKELRKVWEKDGPNLSFESGYYNKTNTILLDDSPFMALGNPPHTSIFPIRYKYDDDNDNALGDGGSLHTYLEGLANADDAREYIKRNPFGQAGVTESSPYWRYHVQSILGKWLPKSIV